jgi:hypothetical protein
MRVKIREKIDPSRVGDTRGLTSFEVLYVGVYKAIQKTDFFRERREKQLSEEYKLRIKKEENLKESLLGKFYKAFKDGVEYKGTLVKIKQLVSAIPRDQEGIFRDIITHEEFNAYDIIPQDCNPDLLKSFPDIKLRFIVKEKRLSSEVQNT